MTDETRPTPPDFIVLGYIARPHGVHGAVVVTTFSTDPGLILDGQGLELLSPDGATRRPVSSLKGKEAAQGLILKMKDVTTREAALELKGWRIGLKRELMPEVDDDEVYWADLLGLEVFTPEGLNLGQVKNLMEAGAGLVLAVISPSSPEHELLLPYQEQFVVELDLSARRLVLDLPPGLLDL